MIRYTFSRMNKLTYMTQLRLNKAIFFVVAAAMLSMQWSSFHIHLAEHHDHHGNHHQHKSEAHSHQSFTQNNDFIDSDHQTHQQNIKVVELGNNCNIHNWNNIDDETIVSSSVSDHLSFIPYLSSFESSEFISSKRRYIDYSTIKLRAPPKFS